MSGAFLGPEGPPPTPGASMGPSMGLAPTIKHTSRRKESLEGRFRYLSHSPSAHLCYTPGCCRQFPRTPTASGQPGKCTSPGDPPPVRERNQGHIASPFPTGQFWKGFPMVPQRVPSRRDPQLPTEGTHLSMHFLLACSVSLPRFPSHCISWGHHPHTLPAPKSLSQELLWGEVETKQRQFSQVWETKMRMCLGTFWGWGRTDL